MFKRIPHVDEGIAGRDRTENYEDHAEKHAWIMYGAFIRDLKRLAPNGRCLEVGAGPAVMTCLLAEEIPGISITAVDISEDMAARARGRIERRGLTERVDYRVVDVGDAETLDQLGQFDLVYSTMSMHHWDSVEEGLANLLSAVGPDGILYIGDLLRSWWLYWVPSNNGLFTSLRAAYQPGEIKKILTDMGLDNFNIRRLPPYFYQAVTVHP